MTTDQLKEIVPSIKEKNLIYADYISTLTEGWTKKAKAGFVAQLAHESGAFNYVREIASGAAYEGRADLGNTEPGDGKKFRGRGLIQITGRNNYKNCSIFLFGDNRLLDNPEILEQPEFAIKSAVWFWDYKALSNIMNKPDGWVHVFKGKNYDAFEWVTLRINGGQNGIEERKKYYQRALSVL